MSVVPQLKQELVDVGLRSQTTSARRRPGRRVRLVLAVAALLALLGAGALAATGIIGSGQALKPAPHTPHNPKSGLGVPKPGTGLMLPLRADDPDGGPRWGARFVATTRGLGCLQIGRVVDGKIGVLGQDGAFGNDRRFHPLTVNYFGMGSPYGPFPCGVMDAKGHTFAQISMNGVPASGLVVPTARQAGCCPPQDWRSISTGMAGPAAKSVTYRTRSGLRTVPTVGANGAYLLVEQASARSRDLGTYAPGSGGAVIRINYKDGTSCGAKKYSPISACAEKGRVSPRAGTVGDAAVRARVSARIGKGHYGRTVIVSFVAPRGIVDAGSAYALELHFSGPQVNCRAIIGSPLMRDVRAGERVSFHEPTSGCRGVFHGAVRYYQGLSGAEPPIFSRNPKPLLVGSFTVDAR